MQQIRRYALSPISVFLIFAAIFLAGLAGALAKNPLGIGVVEQAVNPASPFAVILLKIQSWQMQFERVLQNLLVGMRDSSDGIWWLTLSLVGFSFIYGILHAAGPGHGKAVISSYLIADHASLRRGVSLSFFSSLLQAMSAVAIILLIFFFLPGQLTQTTQFVVLVSFVLMTFVGLWLLVQRTIDLFSRESGSARVNALFDNDKKYDEIGHFAKPSQVRQSALVGMPIMHGQLALNSSPVSGRTPSAPQLAWRRGGGAQLIANFRQICAECGQIHLVSPNHLQDKLTLKTALSLICATGLRPCNGALFVMSFAMFNQLEWIGILAVFAMSFGTFITVSTLAGLAVYAKSLALVLAKRGGRRNNSQNFKKIKSGIEWCAAFFIFITGALVLLSNLL